MTTETNIREAAVRLFAAKGFAGTGIRDLAREVGITTASLYHYIGTKDDLLVWVMRTGIEALLERGERAVTTAHRPEDQLAGLVRVHVTVHALNPMSSSVVDVELRALTNDARDDVIALRDRYERLWQDVLEAGSTDGVFTADDLHLTRLHLLDLCTGVMRWYRPEGGRSLDDIVERLVELSLRVAGAMRDGVPLTSVDVAASAEPPADELAERRREAS